MLYYYLNTPSQSAPFWVWILPQNLLPQNIKQGLLGLNQHISTFLYQKKTKNWWSSVFWGVTICHVCPPKNVTFCDCQLRGGVVVGHSTREVLINGMVFILLLKYKVIQRSLYVIFCITCHHAKFLKLWISDLWKDHGFLQRPHVTFWPLTTQYSYTQTLFKIRQKFLEDRFGANLYYNTTRHFCLIWYKHKRQTTKYQTR